LPFGAPRAGFGEVAGDQKTELLTSFVVGVGVIGDFFMVMAFVVNQRPFPNAKSHQPAKALTGFPQRR
jgi:hypothetical protein